MTRILVAVSAPRIDAAAISVGDICQPTKAAMAATAHAMGIVRVAGWYSPTISTAIVASGSSAINTSVCSDIGSHPRNLFVRTGRTSTSHPLREAMSDSHFGTTSLRKSIARNLPIQRFLVGCINHAVWQGVFILIYCLHHHLSRIAVE
jgi:hypothetical protein